MNKAVILVAGGKGLRMGGPVSKQYLPIAGKPVLMHTLSLFFKTDPKIHLILVLPEIPVFPVFLQLILARVSTWQQEFSG